MMDHPLFVGLVVTLFTASIGGIGWMVVTLFSVSQINSKAIDLIGALEKRMLKVEDRQDEMSDELSSLMGEHKMMLRAGEIIRQHHFEEEKKT